MDQSARCSSGSRETMKTSQSDQLQVSTRSARTASRSPANGHYNVMHPVRDDHLGQRVLPPQHRQRAGGCWVGTVGELSKNPPGAGRTRDARPAPAPSNTPIRRAPTSSVECVPRPDFEQALLRHPSQDPESVSEPPGPKTEGTGPGPAVPRSHLREQDPRTSRSGSHSSSNPNHGPPVRQDRVRQR